jgi:hypothetical protein
MPKLSAILAIVSLTSTLAYPVSTMAKLEEVVSPGSDGRIPAVKALVDCRAITDPNRRLACYDAAAEAFDKSEAKGDIVVTDRAQVEGMKRQAFGFSLPSLSLFDRGNKPAPINEVQLKVEGAAKDGSGHWIIHLEGGQTWRQIDSDPLSREPKPGAIVTIHHAALDSYLLSVNGSNATIRVHRDL